MNNYYLFLVLVYNQTLSAFLRNLNLDPIFSHFENYLNNQSTKDLSTSSFFTLQIYKLITISTLVEIAITLQYMISSCVLCVVDGLPLMPPIH